MEAALRQRIREARNADRRQRYPYVVDSELVTTCERCRKRASMVRVHRNGAKA